MSVETLERTNLWKHAFDSHCDSNDRHRDRYKVSLLRFRERVGDLLTFIPGDMKQYTVHDLSHLDALWEMADLIAGHNFSLNPAEAFVFGGAVLLHDAGMSVAAYPNGLDEIKAMPEWEDSYSWACSMLNVEPSMLPIPKEVSDLAITDVLRKNHARKAEELSTQMWKNPCDGNQDFLLEDSDLRSHFGRVIGLIAHSHHWSIKRIISEMQSSLGGYGETPAEWTVDCVKVALLLRCADAAHLDHRRAPRLLFSLTRPTGVAQIHWTFQNKLAKPQVRDGKLLYTSRSPFSLAEVDAWHLCWDMMKMVDRELSDSCDVLLDRRCASFHVSGVIGAKSADSLARHVSVDGWRPIPTELQVSDVPHLARTLGGRDLYSLPLAPLRELLQNAADAIDARAALDSDFSVSNARISVKIENLDGVVIVSVEDDGLGMSERTLTGALLDFGTSFWKSDAARNEFPSLRAHFEPRGRYGIGFFSVFMWADSVKVSSRKFNDGLADTRVLEFTAGLGSRPILRPASSDERSTRYSSKVTLQIPEDRWNSLFSTTEKSINQPSMNRFAYRSFQIPPPLVPNQESIAKLTAMLKIPVYFGDSLSSKIVNMPDWETAGSDQCIAFFEKLNQGGFSARVRRFAKSESLVRKNGRVIGRAFLSPSFEGRVMGLAVYELGIFVGYEPLAFSIYGFVEGRAMNAARDKVDGFDVFDDLEWVDKQIDYMTRITENVGDALACQDALISHQRISRQLPICLLNRKECSLDELSNEIAKREKIRFSLVDEDKMGQFGARVVDSTEPFIGKKIDEDRLYFLVSPPDKVKPDQLDQFVAQGGGPLALILREIKLGLGEDSVTRASVVDADSYSNRKMLSVEINRVSDLT